MIAFVGAAFGSVGGVGGGGFFIPMLTLIIGFDQKSAIAVSKCKYIISYITEGLYLIHLFPRCYFTFCFLCFPLKNLNVASLRLVRYDHGYSNFNGRVQFKAKASYT